MIQNELYDPLRYLKDIGTSLSDFREIEKDGKALLSGILNNDTDSVKRIISSYVESAMKKGIDGASVAIMESIGPKK
jgi:hypothetical protein